MKKSQREIKRQAAITAAGLIQSALDAGTIVENMIEHEWSREDAERIEQELTRIVQRLEKTA
jgi:hypothetical protein